MDFLQKLLAMLDDPTVKVVLGLIGGFIWKQVGTTVNKAAPFVLVSCSLIITALHLLFPQVQSAVQPVSAILLIDNGPSFWAKLLSSILHNGILPVIIAVGTHSAIKNTEEWKKGGGKLFHN